MGLVDFQKVMVIICSHYGIAISCQVKLVGGLFRFNCSKFAVFIVTYVRRRNLS